MDKDAKKELTRTHTHTQANNYYREEVKKIKGLKLK